MKILVRNSLVLFILTLSLFSCGDKEKPQTGEIQIYLTDIPASYDKVNLDIQSVEIITDKEKNPIKLNLARKEPINLLLFSNGIDTLLATGNVKIGNLSEIIITFGTNSSLVVGGIKYSLDIPSEEQSVLKLKVNQVIADGVIYKFWIDIDASRSVVKRGNNQYQIVAIARAYSETSSGSIKGQIFPRNARPFVWACTLTDTIGTIADSTGYFLINKLPADTYNLRILPQIGLEEIIVEKIIVESGRTTDAGSIALN